MGGETQTQWRTPLRELFSGNIYLIACVRVNETFLPLTNSVATSQPTYLLNLCSTTPASFQIRMELQVSLTRFGSVIFKEFASLFMMPTHMPNTGIVRLQITHRRSRTR